MLLRLKKVFRRAANQSISSPIDYGPKLWTSTQPLFKYFQLWVLELKLKPPKAHEELTLLFLGKIGNHPATITKLPQITYGNFLQLKVAQQFETQPWLTRKVSRHPIFFNMFLASTHLASKVFSPPLHSDQTCRLFVAKCQEFHLLSTCPQGPSQQPHWQAE